LLNIAQIDFNVWNAICCLARGVQTKAINICSCNVRVEWVII